MARWPWANDDAVRQEHDARAAALDRREREVVRREFAATQEAERLASVDRRLLAEFQRVAHQAANDQLVAAQGARAEFQELLATRTKALDAREAQIREFEEQVAKRARDVEDRSNRASERELAVTEREVRADSGLTDRARALLQEVERREAGLAAREHDLAARDQELLAKAEDLARQNREAADLLRKLREAELAARAGYEQQNRAALDALDAQRDALLRDIQSITGELARLRQEHRDLQSSLALAADEVRAALDAEIGRARQERIRANEEEFRAETDCRRSELAKTLQNDRDETARFIAEARAAADRTIAEARAAADTERARRNEELDRREEHLDHRKGDLDKLDTEVRKQQAAVDQDRMRLAIDRSVLDEDRQHLQRQIEDAVREAASEDRHKVDMQARLIDELRAERDRTWQELQALEDVRARAGGNPEGLLVRLRDREEEIARLRRDLADRPGLEVRDELRALLADRDRSAAERERLTRDLFRLQAEEKTWVMGVSERENALRIREVAERHAKAMQARVEGLGAEVERLQRLYEKPQEKDKRKGAIVRPHLARTAPAQAPASERAWLDQIRERCKSSGFVFPPRLVKAFHTAVKTAEWSPLTVLAGVSGTGKSKLPELYARFGGLNYLLLSVQPNWDSPHALSGFFNAVDNEYNATPLVKALDQCRRAPGTDNGLNDQLLLVLLDEMNLAHVELYFSDMLSKLEDRRGKPLGAPLELDLGGGEIHKIDLERNVLWVGTMNEDETTKTLSDKVLDRGNIIVFPRPQKLQRREMAGLADSVPVLPRTVWDGWARTHSKFTDAQIGPYKEVLENVNRHLERAGRALGHRVLQSVEHYMSNHPDVIAAGDNGSLRREMDVAFGDQLVQKVMPKLRGIETTEKLKRDCLDPIRELVEPFGIGTDFDVACEAGYGGFVWSSAHYLEDAP